MKFYTALALALLAGNASAFSAVAPKSSTPAAASGGNLEPVDKTMQGIDKAGSFDPTEGDSPALKRNNNNSTVQYCNGVAMTEIIKARCHRR